MQQALGDVGTSDWERGSLIPPRRLGALLSDARAAKGDTLEDLAERSNGRFSLSALSSIERGTRDVSDEDARKLAAIYGLESTSLVPPRSKLIVDLSEGLLSIDDHRSKLGRATPSRDEVLARYLTMVYSMRRLDPGAPLVLRIDDLDVLGRALRVGSRTLEADLEALMAHPQELLGWRARVLKRRVLIPAAGVMVALLGVGALVLVQGPQQADAGVAPADAVPAAAATVTSSVPVAVSVDVGSAVVQERNPDGTPGPVVVRNGEGASPAAQIDVGLIAPETTEQGAHG
ncbi:MAG: helix-turn-helix transcriptional regulator [Acidimicrobiales bacterium]